MQELGNLSSFAPRDGGAAGDPACASPAGAPPPAAPILLQGMSAIFGFLGRGFVCLDRDFKVVHTSERFDEMAGNEAAGGLAGRPVQEVLGAELLGPGGTLRRALEAGERREGWAAEVQAPAGAARLLSITVAPVDHARLPSCDEQVAYLVVVRPAEEGQDTGSEPPTAFAGMVARSQPMQRIFRLVEHLQQSDATVLLTGESGTGKELVARALHSHSPRRRGPCVAVNCAALPGDLLESELFGHVRGAFTGAVRDRVGRFELASEGTLFLDEVGDLPPPLQVKLLRVLQERTFERVGESRSRPTSARIVAATNQDLRRAISEGRFREDLYYRLRVVPIEIPPLRQRREDIEPLARHLLQRVLARHARALRLAPQALRALLRYDWPGNVRELENAMEYAVAVCQGQTIHAEDLPGEVSGPAAPTVAGPGAAAYATPRGVGPEAGGEAGGESGAPGAAGALGAVSAPGAVEAIERERLLAALSAHRWRRDQAAHALGISRTTLWRRMRELRLDARSDRPALSRPVSGRRVAGTPASAVSAGIIAVPSGDATLQRAVASRPGELPVCSLNH
jgi:DNA-binding NtrC family response regulator